MFDYPILNGPVPDACGAALTPELIDRVRDWFLSPEYREKQIAAERAANEEARVHWARMEQWWLREHGATEMTPVLRDQFYDDLWDALVTHTNILEVLS